MNQEQLNQALQHLKTITDLLEKRQWGKGIRAGAIAGGHQLHAAYATDELIDTESAAQLDTAADQWLGFLGAGA